MASESLWCAVWMVTYNHEQFIGKAIESVLRQKVTFSYRIFLSDDCSSDKTSAICRSYAEKYPDMIDLLVRPKNIGATNNGLDTYYRCFRSGAKYVALLEGDDAWLDEDKLQKQVDILEKHPEYSGCFHNAEERYEHDDVTASFLYCNYPTARTVSFGDMIYNNVVPTCSILFRNRRPGFQFPDWYTKPKMGDWPLHLLNASTGDYWYIPKVMGVHRLHKGGIWKLGEVERLHDFTLEAYDIMIEGFGRDTQYGRQLTTGREAFLASTKPVKPDPRFKRRVKSLVKRIIGKI